MSTQTDYDAVARQRQSTLNVPTSRLHLFSRRYVRRSTKRCLRHTSSNCYWRQASYSNGAGSQNFPQTSYLLDTVVVTAVLGFFLIISLCYGIREIDALPGPTGLVTAQVGNYIFLHSSHLTENKDSLGQFREKRCTCFVDLRHRQSSHGLSGRPIGLYTKWGIVPNSCIAKDPC